MKLDGAAQNTIEKRLSNDIQAIPVEQKNFTDEEIRKRRLEKLEQKVYTTPNNQSMSEGVQIESKGKKLKEIH